MRKYDTCFFERYAQISLENLLGSEFADLLNEDRPDLQSPDGFSIGIEVTRAMEESKEAARSLLKEIAGITPMAEDRDDISQILENGYGYGLQEGRYIGVKELDYWTLALPLKNIIRSKISKVANGFYGQYRKMGLYVFCKDCLNDAAVYNTARFAMDLQKMNDIRYDRLYLSEVNCLHVCNLADDLCESSRFMAFPISQEQRKEFYLKALWEQFDGA